MKKISFLAALLCASMISFAQEPVYDVNFALASNGSSATASSGDAALAIDGNEDTRWESAQTDDEWFLLDMGQARTFSRISIKWEGAYAKQFALTCSTDGETWSNLYTETNLTQAGWQIIDVTETTAQYIKYQGIQRATQWGQSFYEFQVMLPGVSVLTSIQLTAPSLTAKVGEGIALTAKALDQNGTEMEAEISYEVSPADAGAVVNGKYVPAKIGDAAIVAKSGEIVSDTISVFGYEGSNLALSTSLTQDNKIIAQSAVDPNGSEYDAFFAVDGNTGSVWQGRPAGTTGGSEEERTFDSWFVVDLGGYYSIDLITITFEGACSQEYHVDFSENNTTWARGYNYVGTAGINGHTDLLAASDLDNNLKVRYVRFWSTKAATEWGMKMFDFQVFGHEWVPSGDTEAPVMVSATLESKTWSSAVIAVSATDNNEVTKYHVVDATNAIDVKLTPNDNKITVSGLSASTTYNFTITALDASLNESTNSKTVEVTTDAHAIVPATPATAPTWPANQVKSIFSDAYPFAPASLNSYNEGWWDAPTLTIDTVDGDSYLHYNLYRNGMIGAQFAEVSVALMEKIHIDVFSSADGSVTFRPIIAGDTDAQNNVKQTLTLVGGQWNSFDFDMSDFGEHNWTRVFQYAIEGYQAGGLVGEHISVDNIYFYRTTPIEDDEAPTNVSGRTESEDYFSATLALAAEDNMGSVLFIVKLGEDTVATGGGLSADTVLVTVKNLLPDAAYTFTVIATDDAGNAAEGIEISAHTKAAPAPAPTPELAAEDVKSLFSDAYEPATTVNDFRQDWWQGATLAQGQLAEGDNVLYYICVSEAGAHGWAFAALDATGYNKLHVSIYPLAEGSFRIYPVVEGTEEASYYRTSETLVANEWNEVVFDFADLAMSPMGQLGWNSYAALGSFFIDNVYFFKEAEEGIEDVEAGVKAVKVIENGQLIIIKNGVRYTLMGAQLR